MALPTSFAPWAKATDSALTTSRGLNVSSADAASSSAASASSSAATEATLSPRTLRTDWEGSHTANEVRLAALVTVLLGMCARLGKLGAGADSRLPSFSSFAVLGGWAAAASAPPPTSAPASSAAELATVALLLLLPSSPCAVADGTFAMSCAPSSPRFSGFAALPSAASCCFGEMVPACPSEGLPSTALASPPRRFAAPVLANSVTAIDTATPMPSASTTASQRPANCQTFLTAFGPLMRKKSTQTAMVSVRNTGCSRRARSLGRSCSSTLTRIV